MGQKVNPISLRLGYNKVWDSFWYAKKDKYADNLHEDIRIRKFVETSLSKTGVSRVCIERVAKKVRVIIHSARPGMIVGKKGADVEKVKKTLEQITSSEVSINIVEVKKIEIEASLVAQNVAQQLEKRVTFRKAMKRAVSSAMQRGAKGIRINVAGRLGGAEIARMEWYREGRVPLHTIRADIDYGTASAHTTYGVIGIKVWIYKGDSNIGGNNENKKMEKVE